MRNIVHLKDRFADLAAEIEKGRRLKSESKIDYEKAFEILANEYPAAKPFKKDFLNLFKRSAEEYITYGELFHPDKKTHISPVHREMNEVYQKVVKSIICDSLEKQGLISRKTPAEAGARKKRVVH